MAQPKAFRLRWEPSPAFKKMLHQVANKKPLYNKLTFLMFAMVGEHHRHGGTKQRWAKPWRWANKKIMAWWRPDINRPRITNSRRWATDFYYGHGYRITRIPAHYRRIRRMYRHPDKVIETATISGSTFEVVRRGRRRKTTVAITRVRAHNRRVPPHPAHEIWWTRRWIKKAEGLVLKHVLV